MRLIRLAARMAALPCQAILAFDDWLNPKPKRQERLPVASVTYSHGGGHHGRRVRREELQRQGGVQTRVRRRA
jgi:hypothetical protein